MEKNLSTRRLFLQRGLTLLAASTTIPTFLDQTVMALDNPLDGKLTQQPTGKDGKILVVVQLSGGNDGLATVIPYGDDVYYKARTDIAHAAKDVLKIDDYIGLNPNLLSLKKLYDAGNVGIVQGVGYPNPNRSHFRSMDIWQSAQPDREVAGSGWLGRYFDNTCAGIDSHVGVSIGDTLPLAMQGERILPLNLERPETYRYNGRDKAHYLSLNQLASTTGASATGAAASGASATSPVATAGSRIASGKIVTGATQLDFLHRTAMDAQVSSDDILRITKAHVSPTEYPAGDFGRGLKTIAAMIGGGMPTRVYYVALGGFDTHAAQIQRHDPLMKQLADGLSAFWADLSQQKNQDRVLTMTFSEFGRRLVQNASNGTDHGAAAPMFVMGSSIKQGIIGKHPSLTNLDQGDLKFGVDFRSVYASVLQNWLETPSKPILGDQFDLLPIVKA
jgi:uncharacterized protein (DUF1501 family)